MAILLLSQGWRFRMAEYGSFHTLAQSGAVKNYPNLSLKIVLIQIVLKIVNQW